MMKELKILLLALTIGFSSEIPVSLKCTKAYYPNTIKGGLQTTKNLQSAKVAVPGVEGLNTTYRLSIRQTTTKTKMSS